MTCSTFPSNAGRWLDGTGNAMRSFSGNPFTFHAMYIIPALFSFRVKDEAQVPSQTQNILSGHHSSV